MRSHVKSTQKIGCKICSRDADFPRVVAIFVSNGRAYSRVQNYWSKKKKHVDGESRVDEIIVNNDVVVVEKPEKSSKKKSARAFTDKETRLIDIVSVEPTNRSV